MAERAGFDEHLPKPIDADLVLAALARGTSLMRASQAESPRQMTPPRAPERRPSAAAN